MDKKGHSFCKSCILRVADYDNKCPLCRRVIHITPEYGINMVLNEIVTTQFPKEYQKRKEETEKVSLFCLSSINLH